ncbi:hypothetical protein BGZ72_007657 [Mortierella alpina]|nr:hypothetical protein BGZ72_007657 [Mortierella alpina]
MSPMGKRNLDGQPMPSFIHQIAPEPTPQRTASPLALTNDDHPAIPPQHASASTNKRNSFWTQSGIREFIDWITTPENYDRLYKHRSISGERILDIQSEIAQYVNAKAGTTWVSETVKQKTTYAKVQYTRAAQLTRKRGEREDAFQARRHVICPYFDRFHVVYASNFSANPPPRQLRTHPGKRLIVESSSEASDFEDYPHHGHEDGPPEHGEWEDRIASRAIKDQGKAPAHKHHRQDRCHSQQSTMALSDGLKRQPAAITTTNDSLRTTWEEEHRAMLNLQTQEHEKALGLRTQEHEKVLNARTQMHERVLDLQTQEHEKVLGLRTREHEKMLQQRSQDHENWLQQRTQERERILLQRAQEMDEVFDRRRRELETDKATFKTQRDEFKTEKERMMKELQADRQEFKESQADMKKSMMDYYEERVRLVAENARLTAKLEIHASINRT